MLHTLKKTLKTPATRMMTGVTMKIFSTPFNPSRSIHNKLNTLFPTIHEPLVNLHMNHFYSFDGY